MADPNVARINALTSNARSTWFALLSVLLFVGITLLSVDDIDFYGYGRSTKLPLVDVSVPTRLFFFTAPILTAAVYGYFHLYLIRLWDALSTAPDLVKPENSKSARPLGDVVSPWLVIDAALRLRMHWRKDRSTTPRALEWAASLLNLFLAWGLGLIVLTVLWWMSMTARSLWMTGLAATALLISLYVGATSFLMMRRRMSDPSSELAFDRPTRVSYIFAGTLVAVFTLGISAERITGHLDLWRWAATIEINDYYQRDKRLGIPGREKPAADASGGSSGGFYVLEDAVIATGIFRAPIDLSGKDIVQKPDNWLPHDLARSEFLETWCKRHAARCTNKDDESFVLPDAFTDEWFRRRSQQIASLGRPDYSVDTALTDRKDRDEAKRNALDLNRADLSDAFLAGIGLPYAQLNGADLSNANLETAQLRGAFLHGANLFLAELHGADLGRAELHGADLSYSLLTGNPDVTTIHSTTSFAASTNDGGAAKDVDVSPAKFDQLTDWRNVFVDASVRLSPYQIQRMGAPCQWAGVNGLGETLSQEAFLGRWRGWLELEPGFRDWRLPDVLRNVTPIPPDDPDCQWKTGPLRIDHGGGR